ncbi:hypothetical protein Thivi_4262 [Thiocystis violascens DSM 198]|uniref:Uncharacterized protein n=1 Tax=Thiocystis violascens (strain ATCC 17096 / DSM 198 / 6111) TaxID=765911 RepID=I3YGF7_THIV6|nr:hypothetical protein Thivi_4262 [Thiocystis violascens DSM 198]
MHVRLQPQPDENRHFDSRLPPIARKTGAGDALWTPPMCRDLTGPLSNLTVIDHTARCLRETLRMVDGR